MCPVHKIHEDGLKIKIPFLLLLMLWVPSAFSQTIEINWNAGSEPDLAGYKLYYGTQSRRYKYCVEVGMRTHYTLISLPEPGDYYFSVTTVDTAGNESRFSQESFLADPFPADPFVLMSNYPNPFNPETRIPYALRKALHISLVVFDILGREVKVLERGIIQPGIYEKTWDGTDTRGTSVANGIYICRLVVGNFCQTRKLILTR
jgi:hypothetical protein